MGHTNGQAFPQLWPPRECQGHPAHLPHICKSFQRDSAVVARLVCSALLPRGQVNALVRFKSGTMGVKPALHYSTWHRATLWAPFTGDSLKKDENLERLAKRHQASQLRSFDQWTTGGPNQLSGPSRVGGWRQSVRKHRRRDQWKNQVPPEASQCHIKTLHCLQSQTFAATRSVQMYFLSSCASVCHMYSEAYPPGGISTPMLAAMSVFQGVGSTSCIVPPPALRSQLPLLASNTEPCV